MTDIVIRNAVRHDVPGILELIKSVGRYISFEDELNTWMGVDPQGLFVAERFRDNEVVGVCAGTILNSDRAFIGLYIVKEELRGRGIGTQLWKSAMAHTGDRNVGVSGYIEHFKLYQKRYGFRFVQNYSLSYYECHAISFPPRKPEKVLDVHLISLKGKGLDQCPQVKELTKSDQNYQEMLSNCFPIVSSDASLQSNVSQTFSCLPEDIIDKIAAYDVSLHGYERTFIVKQTLSWRSCKTLAAFSSNRVVGYCCFRPVVTGHKIISPFYADSKEVADFILFNLLKQVDFSKCPKGIVILFSGKNLNCTSVVEKYGFKDTGRQIFTGFTKENISVNISKIYSFQCPSFCAE